MQQAQPTYSPAINQSGAQVQNGGFVTVRSEAEARAYPVAPGTSVTFKNESAPYCYTKTMGFSQFDKPIFEKCIKEGATVIEDFIKGESFDKIMARVNVFDGTK